MGKKYKTSSHLLVPKHSKLNDSEAKKLFEKFNITAKELPKILITDPAVTEFAKIGDVIKINRKSETAGDTIYYREVINE